MDDHDSYDDDAWRYHTEEPTNQPRVLEASPPNGNEAPINDVAPANGIEVSAHETVHVDHADLQVHNTAPTVEEFVPHVFVSVDHLAASIDTPRTAKTTSSRMEACVSQLPYSQQDATATNSRVCLFATAGRDEQVNHVTMEPAHVVSQENTVAADHTATLNRESMVTGQQYDATSNPRQSGYRHT